jgi:hypothetical protein
MKYFRKKNSEKETNTRRKSQRYRASYKERNDHIDETTITGFHSNLMK